MWKVFLGFVFHRIVLYGISLAVMSYAISHQEKTSDLPPFTPNSSLNAKLMARVAELPEAQAIASWQTRPQLFPQLITEGRHPFIWLGVLLSRFLGVSPSLAIVILSNLFFLLLLWELYQCLSRISSEEIASLAGIFVVFWPTSYELSLGSGFSADAFFIVWATRLAIDDKWWLCGLSLFLLGVSDAAMVGLLPLILCWFWFYTRHYQWFPILKRAALIAVPCAVAIVISRPLYEGLTALVSHSALFALWGGVQTSSLKWTLSQSMAGQTFAILFLAVGAVIAAKSNFSGLHRAMPIYFLLFWLLFTPFGALASKAPMAGVCFQGIANTSSRPVARTLLALLLMAGIYEVYTVFI